jgi:xanthine dehydrogenase YagR molybdenum-binding subunit
MAVMDRVQPSGVIGADVPRADGVLKATGVARYGADQPVEGAAFAFLATSTIARGRITSIDDRAARAIPGVLEIFTHENVGKAVSGGRPMTSFGFMASGDAPLGSDRVRYAGEVVALAVAETFEAARDASLALDIAYEPEPPTATFGCAGAEVVEAKAMGETEYAVGDFARAFAAAEVTVEQRYETPAQHHNPLELFQTTCAWGHDGGDRDELTVWESTQNVRGAQHGVAAQLDIKPKRVRVISPFIGGAFGSRGELAQSTALVAFAARKLGRPVKLVVSRQQGFTLRTFRAETQHLVKLGASRDGKLQALFHEGWELTSRDDRFAVAGIDATTRLYGCANLEAKVHNVTADRQTPGFMRAPPETPYLFALESAMDELSYALDLDPIELRRRNDTKVDNIKGLPFSSRSLVPCFDAAAEAFGWHRRQRAPRSMKDGPWQIGWGCASSMYPTQIAPASCRVTLTPEGRVLVETSASDIGTGAYTIFAQTAADLLRLPLTQVEVRLGDSSLPAAPLSAGSNTSASVCTVIAKACLEIRESLADEKRALPAKKALVVEVSHNPDGAPPLIGPALVGQGRAVLVSGTKHKHHVQFAFGAQLVEVRVHEDTGEIRVPRIVGAYAAGRVMNPRTARSQLMGAQIWGISAALLEATEIDVRSARYTNADLSEYLLPVNADIGEVTSILVPEEDTLVNPLGVKGLGELGNVGVNAAIANAIFHATGIRRRSLPIRSEHLLGGAS